MRHITLLVVLLIAGCASQTPATPIASASHAAPATQPATQPTTVAIDNFHFTPSSITVARGATVTWVNHDDVPHTATANGDTPAFDSGALDTDEKFSFTFTAPGTFTYFCKVHPHMTGTVIVK